MQHYKSNNDLELIELTKQGDQEAFRWLVERYERKVAATVLGMLGNCEEADDVGQEVFIRFYRNIEQFRGEAAVGTYLTRIAVNLSLNELKRRRRKFLFFDFSKKPEEVKEVADTSTDSEQLETKDVVHKAIQQLESNFRSVVVLRLIEGYSTKETAEILKVPLGTVLSRLTRAQLKLRNLLRDHMNL